MSMATGSFLSSSLYPNTKPMPSDFRLILSFVTVATPLPTSGPGLSPAFIPSVIFQSPTSLAASNFSAFSGFLSSAFSGFLS